MDKPWLQSYPKNVPHEIDLSQFDCLVDMFIKSCDRYASRSAMANLGHTYTYATLKQAVFDFANFLRYELQLKPGARVGIMMPNLIQYPVALFGILCAGCVVVNINPLYTVHELEHLLQDSQATTVVVLANMAHVLGAALARTSVRHVVITEVADCLPWYKRAPINFIIRRIKKMVPEYYIPHAYTYREAIALGAKHHYEPYYHQPEDMAFLQYTGGTTGVAKAAVLSHRNIVANVLQCAEWLHAGGGDDRQDTVITGLPLYHIFSLTCNCMVFLKLGGLNVLVTNPRDIKTFIKILKSYPFTLITAVNTLFNALLHAPGFAQVDFSHMDCGLSGGMALQSHIAEKWYEVTGKTIIEGYGLTETSPVLTINPRTEQVYTGYIGLPLPSTLLSIRDESDQALPVGSTGEICAKGPQVMQEYWNRPDETQGIFTPLGWLRTGDVGIMTEEGFFKIVDRKKDMIIVSGFNVYPNEVEDVIASHSGVLEVGVVGKPDSVSGELIQAYIVKKDNDLTEDMLKAHCLSHLTRYKVPKEFIFIDNLPKSNVGKVLRRELKQLYQTQEADGA